MVDPTFAADIARAVQAPDTRAKLVEMGADETVMHTPEEFASLVGQIVENEMLNGEVIRLDGALRMAPR